jgi:rfaE bifunctional protein kinase chain/domain
MNIKRLQEILTNIQNVRIAVVGDFFLDKYLMIDPSLKENSMETGLPTRQVVQVRCQLGAAGTVSANLHDIGVGEIFAVTAIGDDGEGHELKRGMRNLNINMDFCIEMPGRYTPTYTKPLVVSDGPPKELERLDLRNHIHTPVEIEDKLIANITFCLEQVDAVLIMDQVEEHNCGIVTDRVRDCLNNLAAHSDKIFYVDSRKYISHFRNMIVKCNNHELMAALKDLGQPTDGVTLEQGASTFRNQTHKPVYITMGEKGMLLLEKDEAKQIPALKVEGELDIVGAGDCASSAIVSTLCAGATFEEAGAIANLASSITIKKLGTTGTASPEELIEYFQKH